MRLAASQAGEGKQRAFFGGALAPLFDAARKARNAAAVLFAEASNQMITATNNSVPVCKLLHKIAET